MIMRETNSIFRGKAHLRIKIKVYLWINYQMCSNFQIKIIYLNKQVIKR